MIDAGHTSTNHAMSHFNMNHDINNSSAADSVSTQELIEQLDNLNHLVDDLTIGSMIEPRSVNYVSNPPPTLDNTLARKIIELNLNSSQAREYVSLYRLRDSIFQIIHDNYFRSEFYFSGVPTESLRTNLDRMVLALLGKGMFFIYYYYIRIS